MEQSSLLKRTFIVIARVGFFLGAMDFFWEILAAVIPPLRDVSRIIRMSAIGIATLALLFFAYEIPAKIRGWRLAKRE